MRGILVTLVSVTALVGAATVNTFGCHTDPSEASAICRAPGSEGVLVAHERCNKFYKCSHGHPVAIKCPNDLLYDPELERCEWPKDVDCGNRTLAGDDGHNNSSKETDEDKDDFDNNGHDDPSQAPEICARPGSDGALVAHERCHSFYKCYRGHPIALRCPPLLHYNPKIQKCDWPKNVDCGNRSIHDDDSNESDNEHGGESTDSDEDNDSGHDDGHKDEGHPDPSQAPTICAKHDSDGVLVAHEYCSHFYICLHGRPFPNICPHGLLFDPKGRVCDWPKNVHCGNRTIPKDNDTDTDHDEGKKEIYNDPSKAPEICAEHESVLVAHEYCNYFYQCAGGKPVARKCPAGLVYNYYKVQCDWPNNVRCGKRIIKEDKDDDKEPEYVTEKPVLGHDDPSKAPAICAKKGSDGVLVAHEYCNQFYICAAGVPVARPCPKGLLYNPKKERCDWSDVVDCGNRIPPVEGNGGCDDDKDDEDHGHHEGNNDPSKAPEICAEEGSDGVLIAHEYCHKFYICVNSRPVSRDCPKGLLFNPRKNECDWPENVRCWGRLPREKRSAPANEETSNSYDVSEARRICSKEESHGILVAHKYCNKFYQCVDHQPIAMHCPSVLHFSPKEQHCDWSENVDCGDRIIPEEKDDEEKDDSDEDKVISNNYDDPSQAPRICAKEDSDGIHVAHEHCNKFYICVNRRPFALECPGNLWYNPKIERCDWRQNVECNGRLKPEAYM